MTMFLIHLIPNSWLHAAIMLAIVFGLVLLSASWLIKWFPVIGTYQIPLQILGTVLLLGGVYGYGGYDTEQTWSAKVDSMTKTWQAEDAARDAIATAAVARAKAAVEAADDINQKLNLEQSRDKVTIVSRAPELKQVITMAAPVIDKECPTVDQSVISTINNAAVYPGAKR